MEEFPFSGMYLLKMPADSSSVSSMIWSEWNVTFGKGMLPVT